MGTTFTVKVVNESIDTSARARLQQLIEDELARSQKLAEPNHNQRYVFLRIFAVARV